MPLDIAFDGYAHAFDVIFANSSAPFARFVDQCADLDVQLEETAVGFEVLLKNSGQDLQVDLSTDVLHVTGMTELYRDGEKIAEVPWFSSRYAKSEAMAPYYERKLQEERKNLKRRVYYYWVRDKPDTQLVMISEDEGIDAAREELAGRFGERLIRVTER